MNEEMLGGRAIFGSSSYHCYLLVDVSGSMGDLDHSGTQKAVVVAQMIQMLINILHDNPEIECLVLTVVFYDSRNWRDVVLSTYDVKSETYYENTDLGLWNRLDKHGWETPIGKGVAFVRELAETWIRQAVGIEQRRAVIYVMSDGMNNDGPDGTEEKAKIEVFNASSTQGRIRLSTIGFFQNPDQNPEEAAGRELLQSLVTNRRAYFENDDPAKIANYITTTVGGRG